MHKWIEALYRTVCNYLPRQSESKIASDAAEYWSASDDSEKIQDYSHWRGKGRWQDEKWLQIGADHYAHFINLCNMAGVPPASTQTMIEWGPGGGSNALQFAKLVSDFYAVDISQSNLTETGRQLRSIAYNGFHPCLIPPEDPSAVQAQIDSTVDFFLSTAVFQHFPSKAYGMQILAIAEKLLKPDGLALVQIRYDDKSTRYRSKQRDYKRQAITFTSYRIDEFWIGCVDQGFSPLLVYLDPKVNYAYYYLIKTPDLAP
ncbi:MAG: methyltransferase domain-containing protein [Desulfobacterales bacterium]|jgi:hypothetical protein